MPEEVTNTVPNTENNAPNVPNVQTPTAQTPTPQPTVQVETPNTPVDYSGSTVLETSINIFSSGAGIDAGRFETAIDNAVKYNDPALINIAELTAGLKPEQAAQATALAQAAFKETQSAIARATTEATNAITQLAGGEEQWVQYRDAFNAKAPEHLKAVVANLLESGDVKNAVQFVMDTAKGVGLVNSGGQPMQGGTGGNGADTKGLSVAEFNTQLAVLEREAGNRSLETGEYAQKLQLLRDARKLGRNNGL